MAILICYLEQQHSNFSQSKPHSKNQAQSEILHLASLTTRVSQTKQSSGWVHPLWDTVTLCVVTRENEGCEWFPRSDKLITTVVKISKFRKGLDETLENNINVRGLSCTGAFFCVWIGLIKKKTTTVWTTWDQLLIKCCYNCCPPSYSFTEICWKDA